MTNNERYPAELRERAVRMVLDNERLYGSRWEAICSVALKLGPSAESVHKWVCRSEINAGACAGVASVEHERLLSLERENRELRRADEILAAASALVGAELDGQSRS